MRGRFGAIAIAALLGGAGCSGAGAASGPVNRMIDESAARSGVSRDLVAAIAAVEGGYKLALHRDVAPGELVQVAGVLEIRHAHLDSLARGAALVGARPIALENDLALGTDAGVRVLAELGKAHGARAHDLASWAEAIEEMSGYLSLGDRIDYRARVMKALHDGRTVATRAGEAIEVAAHPEVPIALTFAPPPERTLDMPEYAGAIWFDTPSDNKWTPGREAPVSMIAIHDTEGDWDASVATLQNDPAKSVHYIVDADGSRVGQFVHEADTAWHVGNWYYNVRMIGIEHVGVAADDAYQTPMYETSAKLVRDIAKRNQLGPNGDGKHLDRSVLVGHQEVPDGDVIPESDPPCPDSPASCVQDDRYGGANNHRDPGVNWEWCHYTDIIGQGASCKCNDVFDHFNCSLDGTFMAKCDGGMVETEHCVGGCTIQPIGVDDTCNASETSSSSSAGGGAGGASPGSGGAPNGAGGSGGHEPGHGHGHGGSGGSGGSVNAAGNASGCAFATSDEPIAPFALAALAWLASRRRRRG
jgi:MYXO-CTERM domain-containing protein